MEWVGHLFEKYPEMAVYLAIGLGYCGGLKFRGAGIGAVTGLRWSMCCVGARQSVRSHNGGRVAFRFPAALGAQLTALADRKRSRCSWRFSALFRP